MHQGFNYSKLIFVYNADSGVLNAVKDAVHKIFKPQTYGCNLCAVTFGPVSMKSEWGRYIEALPVSVEFLHRNEFIKQYGADNKSNIQAHLNSRSTLTQDRTASDSDGNQPQPEAAMIAAP